MSIIIDKSICQRVAMTGVKYKDNHPGGISAVVRYWSEYIDGLQYYPTFQEGTQWLKAATFISAYSKLYWKLLTDSRVEIVHIHTAAGTDFERSTRILQLAKRFGKKIVLHSHASQFKVYYASVTEEKRAEIVCTLKKADVLIALSESWKEWFISLGVEPTRIVILHNITAYPTILDDVRNARATDLTNRPVRFLFMGEIGDRKGVFDIIRGLREHRNEIAGKLELRIGGNKREEELRKAITDGGLLDIVKFEGWVAGDKKIELLNWADVYILPSFNEGLPISILEAMSYKMPIISTPVGGIPEVVDKSNGILVTPGHHDEIFIAMKHYLDVKTDILKHGNESYKKVETYLPDYVLVHLKDIYEDLLCRK